MLGRAVVFTQNNLNINLTSKATHINTEMNLESIIWTLLS